MYIIGNSICFSVASKSMNKSYTSLITSLIRASDRSILFIKRITGKTGNNYTIRETGKFLSDLINEIKIKYEIKE